MSAPFPVPRVRRSKGYRSKGPAANGGVSSWTFSDADLPGEGGYSEHREGNTATGSQPPVGILALHLARGGRIITRS